MMSDLQSFLDMLASQDHLNTAKDDQFVINITLHHHLGLIIYDLRSTVLGWAETYMPRCHRRIATSWYCYIRINSIMRNLYTNRCRVSRNDLLRWLQRDISEANFDLHGLRLSFQPSSTLTYQKHVSIYYWTRWWSWIRWISSFKDAIPSIHSWIRLDKSTF